MISNQMPISTPSNNNQQPLLSSEPNSEGTNTNLQTPLLQEAAHISTPNKIGLDKLTSVEGITISQSIKEFEFLSWSSSQRHYFLYDSKGEAKRGEELLKIVEISANNSFNMEVNLKDSTKFMRFELRSGCDFATFNKAEMEVFLVEGGQRVKLGKIKFPFTWGGLLMEVFDANDSLKYVLKRPRCQSWCLTRAEAELTVCDPFGEVVERLVRNVSVHRDNRVVVGWPVNFPKDSSAGDRALLLAATMMIEHYEIEKEPQDSTSSGLCDCL